ncbi:MAG: lysylphosphatidylglycerol synthase transmembrane domain-containing protein, partial [Halomonas sp.]
MAGAWRLSRPLAGLVLLIGLAWLLEPSAILAQVQRLSPGWALLALALTLPPLLLSVWRWRLTARLLGLSLGFRWALREYYLALFLNQVLPGGVAGDAARAWRHSRHSGRRAGAWRAVIIERASGQLAMALLSLAVLVASPLWHELLADAARGVAASGWLPAGGVAVLLLIPLGRQLARRPPAAVAGLGGDLRRSLLAASVWPKQLAGSLLVVVSYALVFVCAARAIGVELALPTLLALVPPVLLAMLIPLSLAGWGVREGAAALVWGLAGLPPAQGVAVSMAYGLIVLLASLPGGLLLLQRTLRPPRGKAGLAPGGSGGGRVEHQIEEGIVTTAEGPRRGTPRLLQSGNGRHGKTRPAGA